MQATIVGETEEGIGVDVTDNNEIVHEITFQKDDWEIVYHEQDGYPDKAAERTPEGNEHVEQARRYAQYYVYVERGYDTVPPLINPDRLELVRRSLADLSISRFEEHFGDLHQQLASYHGGGERVLELPPLAAKNPKAVLYRKDVYLGVDPTDTEIAGQAREIAADHGFDLDELSMQESSFAALSPERQDDWEEFAKTLADAADGSTNVADGAYLDCVSDLQAVYGDGEEKYVTDAEPPLNREPDARLELAAIEPGSLEEFQAFLEFVVRCQIRDCFVRMGLEPPEEYRVLGYGGYEATERYRKVDFYPRFDEPGNEALLG